ncbi:MAG: PLP-dependent aminotransferase family protein [Pseudomonadales bacterium]
MPNIDYDFGTGRSDPSTFPTKALQDAAVAVIGEEADALTEYHGSLGHEGLREAMAARESEREGVPVSAEHLLLTNGSMQGVTLTAEALQETLDDDVIVEEFSYPGTLSAYRSLRYQMHGIELDDGGMRMDQLEDTLKALDRKGRRPRFIYAISTYQNPTGFTMPRARRLEMIALAARYDVPIIEDNCYGDVHYEGEIEPAIYALDDNPNHIYLCSLSKILAPGLRLGYVLARPPMLERIIARRHDAGGNYLAAAIAARFYRHGISEHAEVANPVLRDKRDALLRALTDELDDLCVWSRPSGGLFVWLRVPDDVDRKRLLKEANANGVHFLTGAAFHYRRADVPYLRLAFGHLTIEQIEAGVPRLAQAIRKTRTSNEMGKPASLFSDIGPRS